MDTTLPTSSGYAWHSGADDYHGYLLPAIRRLLPPGEGLKILDVGCGNGYLASCYASLGHRVVGFDSSVQGVEIAQRDYPRATFKLGSVYDDYSAFTEPVDVVISSEVIEHLDRPATLLARCHSILKPRGTLILTTPYHGYWKNLALSLTDGWDKHFQVERELGHIKFFSERTLTAMLQAQGFGDFRFNHAGRAWKLWKSLVVSCTRN